MLLPETAKGYPDGEWGPSRERFFCVRHFGSSLVSESASGFRKHNALPCTYYGNDKATRRWPCFAWGHTRPRWIPDQCWNRPGMGGSIGDRYRSGTGRCAARFANLIGISRPTLVAGHMDPTAGDIAHQRVGSTIEVDIHAGC